MECDLCHADIEEYGSNGRPLVEGTVCEWCDQHLVLPFRLRLLEVADTKKPPA